MTFHSELGILSGTPTDAGVFSFSVQASLQDSSEVISQKYFLSIADMNEELFPHSSVIAVSSPPDGGHIDGENVYTNGAVVTISATPSDGYAFVGWEDNGRRVSEIESYSFTNLINRSMTATFMPVPALMLSHTTSSSYTLSWSTNYNDYTLLKNTSLLSTNWVAVPDAITTGGADFQIDIPIDAHDAYFKLQYTPSD